MENPPETALSLEDLRKLPKIDLHRHLEGSLRLETLAEIAREHGIDLPSYDIDRLRPYVQITDDPPDFQRFLEKFQLLRRFYTTREAVERVAWPAPGASSEAGAWELAALPRPAAQSELADSLQVAAYLVLAESEAGAVQPRAELRQPAQRVARRPRPARHRQALGAARAASPEPRRGVTPGLRCSGLSCSRFAFGNDAE